MAEETGRIAVREESGGAWIHIDNPERRNAISLHMWDALAASINRLTNERARFLVLASAVPGCFGSGADLYDLEAARAAPLAFEARIGRAHDALASFPGVAIAAIDGTCFGGALALASGADVRVATTRSTFRIPAVTLGLGYPVRETEILVRAIGTRGARRLLLTGALWSAMEALAFGLVDNVVEGDALAERVDALVATASTFAPLSVVATKAALRATVDPTALPDATAASAAAWASDDLREGLRAFRERRAPHFEGR